VEVFELASTLIVLLAEENVGETAMLLIVVEQRNSIKKIVFFEVIQGDSLEGSPELRIINHAIIFR
jgi:hypothetical protein